MNFEGLFVYDMANNHQGDLEHGLRIIKEFAGVSKDEVPVQAACYFHTP